jgi:uncharacterized membrane protein YkoI
VRTVLNSLCLATVLAAAAIGAGAWAVPAAAAAAAHSSTAQGLSMGQAVRMVEQRFGARVVRAGTEQQDGRTVYVLRVLDRSGRVFTVRVDAASGRIL